MVGATFISSWNPDSFARMGNFEDGEYYITINHNTLVNPKPYGISEYQVNTPFTRIKALYGISDNNTPCSAYAGET